MGKKKKGWHTSVFAGQKSRVHFGAHGKVTARIPMKTSGQGFTKDKKKRR